LCLFGWINPWAAASAQLRVETVITIKLPSLIRKLRI